MLLKIPLVNAIAFATIASAFHSVQPLARRNNNNVNHLNAVDDSNSDVFEPISTKQMKSTRKAFLASIVSTGVATISASVANADEEGFESIAARAAKISKMVEAEEDKKEENKASLDTDSRTVYDFTVPMSGNDVPFKDLIKQEFITTEISGENEGEVITKTDAKVKAILVVNIKQDDPIARKNIPELISLAAK